MSVPAADRSPAARGRRPLRPSGDDRELAILATAERLLAEKPLSAVSVDDLMARSDFITFHVPLIESTKNMIINKANQRKTITRRYNMIINIQQHTRLSPSLRSLRHMQVHLITIKISIIRRTNT